MSKLIGIYQLTSPSGKVYIGQSWDIKRRWYLYSLGHCVAQRHLHNSIKKYSFESHKHQVLETFPNTVEQSTLDAREQFYMDLRKSEGVTLLNLRGGGSTGKLSDETKDKIRKANTGFNPTPETRRKLSEWQQGRRRPHIAESNKRRAAEGTLFLQNRVAPRGKDHPRYKPYKYERKRLAVEYGVSVATVAGIVDGRLWKHLLRRNNEWENVMLDSDRLLGEKADTIIHELNPQLKAELKKGGGRNGRIYIILSGDARDLVRIRPDVAQAVLAAYRETGEWVVRRVSEYQWEFYVADSLAGRQAVEATRLANTVYA